MLVEDRVAPGVDRCLMYALLIPHHVIDFLGESLNAGVAVGLVAVDRKVRLWWVLSADTTAWVSSRGL